MKLHISKGNMKMDKVPSSSLIPGKDCDPVNCKFCSKECYAMKAWRLYPTVKKAWGENSKLLHEDDIAWEREHILWLVKHKPRLFRFNVGGDIISKRHFFRINRIAEACPDTKFLIFTKAFKYVHANSLPDNLTLVLSVFPGMKVPKLLNALPRAYAYRDLIKDFADHNRFQNAIECHGGCEACGMCWEMRRLGKDVRFEMH